MTNRNYYTISPTKGWLHRDELAGFDGAGVFISSVEPPRPEEATEVIVLAREHYENQRNEYRTLQRKLADAEEAIRQLSAPQEDPES